MKSQFRVKGIRMNRRHLLLLAALIIIPSTTLAEPEPDAKKPQAKPPLPPLPGSPFDEPLLPLPPMKKAAADEVTPFKKAVSDEPLTLPREALPEPAPLPRANDTGKPFDVIAVASTDGVRQVTGRVSVGFFNHSDRDLILDINGRTVTLNSRYYLQLKLPREFAWREKEGPVQKAQVPDEADGLEIVFRK
jgi:hypothetical protein